MVDNSEVIEKANEALTTSGLGAGELNRKQQTKFTSMVRDRSVLLKAVRFEPVDVPKTEIDKLHIGEPVTELASEDTAQTAMVKPKFTAIPITTKKLRSEWALTHETLSRNLEKQKLADTVMNNMTMAIANDMERLAISGDTAIYGSSTTRLGKLLKSLDGWDVQTEECPFVDVGGASISKKIFALAKRRFPKQFWSPRLRWILSSDIADDYRDLIGDRATRLGDDAIQGENLKPLGIPMLEVPLFPVDKSLTVSGATPGWAYGVEFGPFVVSTGVNDKLKIDVDNAGAITVTLTAGTWEAHEIAYQINSTADMPDIARADNEGRLVLESPTTGSSSEIDIQSVGNNAYATLGLSVGVNAGSDAGINDTVNEGSFILLTDPRNLIVAPLQKTRVYSQYNQRNDRIEYDIYNEIDVAIENKAACVKIKNVRLRDLT
jgi:hypothetical protein